MNSPAQAILWELWQTTRKELLIKFAYIAAMMSFLIIMPFGKDFSGPQQLVINGIIVLVIAISSASLSTCWLQLDNTNNGFVFRLGFTRPVSTRLLVALPLLYTVICAVVSYTAPVFVGNFFVSEPIPILGPAAMVAVFAAGMLMATWSPTTLVGRFTCLFLFVVGFIATVFIRHAFDDSGEPLLMALGRAEYYLLPWTLLLTPVLIAIPWLVATHCVNLQRRGDKLIDLSILRTWFVGSSKIGFQPLPPFSSALQAQIHYEVRKSFNRVLLFAFFMAMSGLLFVTLGKLLFANADGAGIVWIGLLLVSPIVFQILASEGALGIRIKQGAAQYSVFDATRPFTNDQLIAIKLLAIALLTVAGWFVVAVVAIPGFLLAVEWSTLESIMAPVREYVGAVQWFWWLGIACVMVLFYIVSGSTLLAAGLWLPMNGNKLLSITGFLYLSLVLAFIDATSKNWSLQLLWEIYGYVFVLAVAYFLIRVLRRAIADGSIASSLFLVSGGLWMIYAGLMFAYGLDLLPTEKMPLAGILASYASIFVPLIAILATPAALAQHRHQ